MRDAPTWRIPVGIIGLFVFLMFSNQGPIGSLGWLFTPAGMIMAQPGVEIAAQGHDFDVRPDPPQLGCAPQAAGADNAVRRQLHK